MNQQRIREILAKIERRDRGGLRRLSVWMPTGCWTRRAPRSPRRRVCTPGRSRRHYYSLGGASNVVANLAALKPKKIQVIGVIGDDIFGRELRRQFDALGVDTTHLVVQREDFDTVAFGKPYLEETEEPRIDFGFFNKRSEATDRALLERHSSRPCRPPTR